MEPVSGLLRMLLGNIHWSASFPIFLFLDPLRLSVSTEITSDQVSRLVELTGRRQHPQLSYNSVAIISKLEMTGSVTWGDRSYFSKTNLMSSCCPTLHQDENIQLLRPHHSNMLARLRMFLKEEDVKFKHLAMAAISHLKKGEQLLSSESLIVWAAIKCSWVRGCPWIIIISIVLSFSPADEEFSVLLGNSEVRGQLLNVLGGSRYRVWGIDWTDDQNFVL